MQLASQDLEKISTVTLRHYDAHAEDFREGTRDHDVTQNIAALLQHIEVEPPFTILDFGCGPGRDLKAFTALGHRAIGLDGAEHFVAMARDATGCEVWRQDFLISICRTRTLTAFSPTPRCSTSPVRRYPTFCGSCTPH